MIKTKWPIKIGLGNQREKRESVTVKQNFIIRLLQSKFCSVPSRLQSKSHSTTSWSTCTWLYWKQPNVFFSKKSTCLLMLPLLGMCQCDFRMS